MVKIIVPQRPFFAKSSDKKSIGCFVGALGCSRVSPDPFFVDFGLELGWIFDDFRSFLLHKLGTVRESFSNSVFGRNLSHAIRMMSAKVCKTSHALLFQERFSKGDGLAQRPQLINWLIN